VNANELADKLEQGHWEGGTREQAATMLRQQAEQINNLQQWEKRQLDVLEALKKEAALQRLSDFTQEADNEPVAFVTGVRQFDPVMVNTILKVGTPLYTHPAKEYKPNQTLECSFDLAGFKPQAKTLTDEEINQVAIDMGMFGDLSHDEIELCRNVLRKSQEK